jgi:hypothetical protein
MMGKKRNKDVIPLSNEMGVRIADTGDAIFYYTAGYSPIRKFVLTKAEFRKLNRIYQSQKKRRTS